jgi:hypothetical protein
MGGSTTTAKKSKAEKIKFAGVVAKSFSQDYVSKET